MYTFSVILLYCVIYFYSDSEFSVASYRKLAEEKFNADSIDLSTPPKPSQKALDQAIILYDISFPKNVEWPIYSKNLERGLRGLAYQTSYTYPKTILIGPSAFSSWGVLGSTIAHEVEVHGRQNFVWFRIQEIMGIDSRSKAELEAYSYELFQAERFGLTEEEIDEVEYFRHSYTKELLKNLK